MRDWIYVDDNCRALDLVLRRGRDGEIYNVGGGHEVANVDLTRAILAELGLGDELVRYVADRARPRPPLRARLRQAAERWAGSRGVALRRGPRAARWPGIAEHRAWWEKIKSGEWRRYYERQYGTFDLTEEARERAWRPGLATRSVVWAVKVEMVPAPLMASTITVFSPAPGASCQADAPRRRPTGSDSLPSRSRTRRRC